jgi:hypothetical protein
MLYSCSSPFLSTTSFASSQRIRSNITVKIAVQSNFWGGIGQAKLFELKIRIALACLWPTAVEAVRRMAFMLRRRPHASARCPPSSAEAERSLALIISLRLASPSSLFLHCLPWLPRLLKLSSVAAVAPFSSSITQESLPRYAPSSPPISASFLCLFRWEITSPP